MAEVETDTSANKAATEQLACTTCRRRKTRCDRVHPCSNCVKAGFECVFPGGRRRPREGRYQLSQRLQKLESHLQDLAQSLNPQGTPRMSSRSVNNPTNDHASLTVQSTSANIPEEIGKLDIDADRSRYSSNVLWATLRQEITEMQDLLQDQEMIEVYDKTISSSPSDTSSHVRTPESPTWLFGARKSSLDQKVSIPEKLDTSILWTTYAENVAPLIKIFHFPTIKSLWQEASSGNRILNAVEETVLDSIYFAAAVSLQEAETRQLFNRGKDQVLQIQRQSLEDKFQEVELLNTGSVVILQAFVLYTVILRRLDDTRLVLSMIGIAARLAIAFGLQRDGSKFKIDFFDAEMRRRLWWQIYLLDFEVSNDHGVDPLLRNDTSDTLLPANLNDEDIKQGMEQAPASILGFSDMTPSLVRFEISATARQLLYPAPGTQKLTLREQKTAIESLQTGLRERYLRFCNNDAPIQWSTTVVARSKITMLWVSLYHQLQQVSATPSHDLNDKIMTAVMEITDEIRDVESNTKTVHWGWYFHNDIQWPATIYLLHGIIKRPPGPLSERAWDVLKRARDQWYANAGSKLRLQGMLFEPMRALTNRAFWVKEGKQPPSYAKVVAEFPELDIPDGSAFDPTRFLDGSEDLGDPFMMDFGNGPVATDPSAFETDFPTVVDQIENFMLPLWDQNWQFLAQNTPP